MSKICSIAFHVFFAVALMMPCSYSLAEEQEENTEQTRAEQEEKGVDLEEVVVTANRYETPVENIPASVTVVTREEIAESSGLRVDHILRKYAGLDVTRSSFLAHSADVVLRGMGEMPGRTLILYDGMPMNKADTGNVNWDLFQPDDIERIEIVRGPASVLYGSNAMGGVINLISRKSGRKPIGFAARGMYGTFNTWDAGATLTGETNNFGYYISYDHLSSDGYNPVPEEERTEYDVKRSLEEDHVKTKFSYEFANKSKISLGYLFFDDKRGEGTKIRDDDGVYRKWKTNNVSLAYDWSIGATDWGFKAYYNKEDYFWNRESISGGKYTLYEVDSDRVDAAGSIQTTFPVSSWNLFTTGFDFRFGSVDADDTDIIRKDKPSDTVVHNEGKQNTYSVFLNDQMTFGERVIVDAGLRYDYVKSYDGKYSDSSGFLPSRVYPDESWDHLTPRVGALYRITDDTSVRGSIGTAFRAPILDDLYRSGILRGKIYAANPDLGPEKTISYEAGVNHNFFQNLSCGLSAYFTRGDDFFYPIEIGIDPATGRDLYQRQNVGEVNIYGVEVEGDWKINEMFTLFGNYTFDVSKIDKFAQQPELEGKYLMDMPRNKANLGVTFYHPDIFRAEMVGRYVGKRYGDNENSPEEELDDYVVFDLKLMRGFTRYCEAYVDIVNLFNKKIMYSSDYEGTGFEIRVGVSFKI